MYLGKYLRTAIFRMTGFDFIRTFEGLREHPENELLIDLDFLLSHYRQKHRDVSLIQIGAFDGVSGDPSTLLWKSINLLEY